MPLRDALLLIGHGSHRFPDAGAMLQVQASRLRAGLAGRTVAVGFLNGEPPVDAALAALPEGPVSVVPFFMEDGYFTRVAIPRALGNASFQLCPPVGLHEKMPDLIEQRGRAACEAAGLDAAETALLVIGHGSASAPGRALALYRHAANVQARGRFRRVVPGCLEEAPFVADVLRGCRAEAVVAVGYFANQGGHMRDDVPALLAAEVAARGAGGAPVRFAGCVADDPAMADIILDQAERRFNEGG